MQCLTSYNNPTIPWLSTWPMGSWVNGLRLWSALLATAARCELCVTLPSAHTLIVPATMQGNAQVDGGRGGRIGPLLKGGFQITRAHVVRVDILCVLKCCHLFLILVLSCTVDVTSVFPAGDSQGTSNHLISSQDRRIQTDHHPGALFSCCHAAS